MPIYFCSLQFVIRWFIIHIIFFYREHVHSKQTKQTVYCNIFELAEIKLWSNMK
jgi:hypothetical protein